MGVFDEDLTASDILKFPQVYSLGIFRLIFTTKKFFIVIVQSLVFSIIIYVAVRDLDIVNDSGFTDNFYLQYVSYFIAIYGVFINYMIIHTQTFNILTISALILSIVMLSLFMIGLSYSLVLDTYGIAII